MSQEDTVDILKTNLDKINRKIYLLQAELTNKKREKNDIKRELLEKCLHKHVIQYRYYGSGMHRAEYSTVCKKCNQYLNFDQYINSETTEKRDG